MLVYYIRYIQTSLQGEQCFDCYFRGLQLKVKVKTTNNERILFLLENKLQEENSREGLLGLHDVPEQTWK